MSFNDMERKKLLKMAPYLIILLGVLLLFFLNQSEVAFVFFFFGVVIIIERIWPEEWETDKQKRDY